jgi:hypothetical protein
MATIKMHLFKSESNMNSSTFIFKIMNWLHEQGQLYITIITLIANDEDISQKAGL